MKHYKITVKGKVQGVWFRKYTAEKAQSLGLKGFVQNQPDGSVYVEVVSDDDDKLQAFFDWLKIGSPLSNVTGVDIISSSSSDDFQSFEIRK